MNASVGSASFDSLEGAELLASCSLRSRCLLESDKPRPAPSGLASPQPAGRELASPKGSETQDEGVRRHPAPSMGAVVWLFGGVIAALDGAAALRRVTSVYPCRKQR